MTKLELATNIATELELPVVRIQKIVQLILDDMTNTFISEGRLELRRFGVLKIREAKPRKARNPKTGDVINVAAKKVAKFRPGKDLLDRVNTPKPHGAD